MVVALLLIVPILVFVAGLALLVIGLVTRQEKAGGSSVATMATGGVCVLVSLCMAPCIIAPGLLFMRGSADSQASLNVRPYRVGEEGSPQVFPIERYQVNSNTTPSNTPSQPAPFEIPSFGVSPGASLPVGDLVKFQLRRDRLNPDLASKFVDFSFSYPTSWKADESAGGERSVLFVDVERALDDDGHPLIQEEISIGPFWFQGDLRNEREAMDQVLDQVSQRLKPSLPSYQEIVRGPLKFGAYQGYGFEFGGWVEQPDANLSIFGRFIILPPSVTEREAGLAIRIVGTSAEPELTRLSELGVKGQLPTVIETFRIGQ